jgi:hypothetical protein
MPGRANPAGRVADYHRGSESAPIILFSQVAAFLYGSAHKYPDQPIVMQKNCATAYKAERGRAVILRSWLICPGDSASDF